jgi:transposase-like protein
MDERKIKLLAEELAKDIKSEADLSKLTQIFVKATVEKALGVEMESHLGYHF